MIKFDPRRTPVRPDLAAAWLAGRVEAARFVEGTPYRVIAGRTSVRGSPAFNAPRTSELLYGERFVVYEDRDLWLWGQNQSDGYVGYVRRTALEQRDKEPTHRVAALRSFLFPKPDFKSVPMDHLTLASRLVVTGVENGYAALEGGGFVFAKHLEPVDAVTTDYVATALRLIGTPYLWGGRTTLGFDCSGLVQIVLALAGHPAPRDSDMQAAEVGDALAESPDPARFPFQRGDLVFFPGHVAIMVDRTSVVHATAYSMSVTVEPLATVAERGGGVTVVRRFPT